MKKHLLITISTLGYLCVCESLWVNSVCWPSPTVKTIIEGVEIFGQSNLRLQKVFELQLLNFILCGLICKVLWLYFSSSTEMGTDMVSSHLNGESCSASWHPHCT